MRKKVEGLEPTSIKLPASMAPATRRRRPGLLAVLALLVACRTRPVEPRIVVVTATPAPIAVATIEPTAEPTASPAPPQEAAAFEVPTEIAPTAPPTEAAAANQARSPSCLEQMAELLPAAEPLIEDFKDEREVARSTPRLSLAPQIARLRDLNRKAKELRWPDSTCGYRLQEKVLAAEENDIDVFTDFLGEREIYPRRDLWPAVIKELAEMQSLVVATGAAGGRNSE